MKTSCPVCGALELQKMCTRELASYKGIEDLVNHFSHICGECGSDIASAEDARENKRAMIRFRKGIDCVPLGCEVKSMRERANLTQVEAAALFGGGPVAFSKYENDDLIPDGAMVNLLKLAMLDSSIVEKLRASQGVHVRISMYQASPAVPQLASGMWVGSEGISLGQSVTVGSERNVVGYGYGEDQQWTN